MPRFFVTLVASAVLLSSAACSSDGSADEDRPRGKSSAAATASPTASRWVFVDAFAALKDADPARRLEAVNWIGAHLRAHGSLAREALRAAATDEDNEVSRRARDLLAAMGDRIR